MSVAAFSDIIKKTINKSLYLTRKEGPYDQRKKLDKENHVMEINQQTLMDGFGISSDAARLLFRKLRNVVKKSTTTYTRSTYNASKKGIFSLVTGSSLVIIARSFQSLKTYLRIYIKNEEKLSNSELNEFDIGHTVGFGLERKNAVSSARLHQASKSVITKLKLDNNLKAIAQMKAIENDFIDAFKNAHLIYTANFDKNVSIAQNKLKGNISFIFTVPQSKEYNNILATLEKTLLKDFRDYNFSGQASKSIKQATDEQYDDIFFGRKPKPYKSSTKTSGKVKLNKENKRKTKTVGYSPVIQRSRSAKGRFQSLVSLQNLLQPLITARVKHNMDHATYFKTRTGQFTSSVKIGNISMTDTNVMQIPYRYDRNPYAAFEAGGTWDSTKRGRDTPSTIIDHSIREVALELVYSKFNITTVGA